MGDTPRIIGLCGYGGVGKDTVARILVEKYEYEQRAFADKLRAFAYAINAYFPSIEQRYSDLIDAHGYDLAKRMYPCVREYLVCIGHSARQHVYETVWIDALMRELEKANSRRFVVSDVRYSNEADRIRACGGVVWRIERPGYGPVHHTEGETIPSVSCEAAVANTGTIEDLYIQVEKLLKS